MKYFYSWWAEDSIKLLEDSYGIKFDGQSMKLSFYYDEDTNTWGTGGSSGISVNMAKTNISEKYPNHLDGLFPHEFTHVMQWDLLNRQYWTQYMIEGMGDLTDGRRDSLISTAGDAEELYYSLQNNTNVYEVGYLFWRYFMKQASDNYDSLKTYAWDDNANIVGTANAELLTGNGENQTISGGDGNDTLTAYSKNSKIYGDNGNDYISSLEKQPKV